MTDAARVQPVRCREALRRRRDRDLQPAPQSACRRWHGCAPPSGGASRRGSRAACTPTPPDAQGFAPHLGHPRRPAADHDHETLVDLRPQGEAAALGPALPTRHAPRRHQRTRSSSAPAALFASPAAEPEHLFAQQLSCGAASRTRSSPPTSLFTDLLRPRLRGEPLMPRSPG